MKRRMNLAISIFVIGFMHVMPILASESELQVSDYIAAYEKYNSNRENEFYGINTFGKVALNEDAMQHSYFIEECDVGAKVWLYETVKIDYMFPSEGFGRTMEFGTEHIIQVADNSEIQIISDTYSEITGYEVGVEEDLAILL